MTKSYIKSFLFLIHILISICLLFVLIEVRFDQDIVGGVAIYYTLIVTSALVYRVGKVGLAYFLTIGIPLLLVFALFMACVNFK
jgi:hypothetical protein